MKLHLEKTNLEKIISSIIFLQKHATEKNIDICYEIDPDIKDHYFWIDSQKISQIINNLINNAIKFTNE
jgi:signal transduction histidine kinase